MASTPRTEMQRFADSLVDRIVESAIENDKLKRQYTAIYQEKEIIAAELAHEKAQRQHFERLYDALMIRCEELERIIEQMEREQAA